MTKYTISAALAAILAGPALAGGVAEPVETPIPVAPVPVAPMNADWTGFYVGAGVGTLSIDDEDVDLDDLLPLERAIQ